MTDSEQQQKIPTKTRIKKRNIKYRSISRKTTSTIYEA